MTDTSQAKHESLLPLAKEGDAAAFDALLVQYMPLIEHQISAARTRVGDVLPEDEKDLRQEACLAFYRAIGSYDLSQREVSFVLYAKICIENALVSALRKLRRATQPLDMEVLADIPAEDAADDPTRRLREQEDYEALCRVIARTLSPYENNIWQRYIAGATTAQIAEALGRDTRSIHNAVYRIRHKLRTIEGLGP